MEPEETLGTVEVRDSTRMTSHYADGYLVVDKDIEDLKGLIRLMPWQLDQLNYWLDHLKQFTREKSQEPETWVHECYRFPRHQDSIRIELVTPICPHCFMNKGDTPRV